MQTNTTNNSPPAQGGPSDSDPLTFQPVFANYEHVLPTEVHCPGCSHLVLRAFKKKKPDASLPTSVYGCGCGYFSAGEVREPLLQVDWERDVRKLVDAGGSLPPPAAEPAAAEAAGSNPLSDSEEDRLAELEKIVDEGLATFVKVGEALQEIRLDRLYRLTHSTFEDYCRDRWQMSKRHANRLIESAEVVQNLGPIGPISPSHESQIRPLTGLGPEVQKAVWQVAVKDSPNGKVTAKQVEDAKRRVSLESKPTSKLYQQCMRKKQALAMKAENNQQPIKCPKGGCILDIEN